jgi:hypothetical protein
MRTSTAYFAGIGTVVAGIAIGLGGGLTIANIVSPHPDKGIETTRLERRMSGEPIPAGNPPAAPVPYLAATQPVAVAPAQAEPRTEAANPVPPPSPGAEPPAATASTAKPQDTPTSSPPAAAPSAEREQAAKPEDAKARDVDVKRIERNRSERRQQWADRRQQWSDRRRHEPRQDEQLHAQEPPDIEQNVREDTEPRGLPAGPRIEFPQIRLFGPD